MICVGKIKMQSELSKFYYSSMLKYSLMRSINVSYSIFIEVIPKMKFQPVKDRLLNNCNTISASNINENQISHRHKLYSEVRPTKKYTVLDKNESFMINGKRKNTTQLSLLHFRQCCLQNFQLRISLFCCNRTLEQSAFDARKLLIIPKHYLFFETRGPRK